MEDHTLKHVSTLVGFFSNRPINRNLISSKEIWMAIQMLHLPPLHFYRNSGGFIAVAFATSLSYLVLAVPVALIEILIGSFSNGSLTRAYDFNRFARVGICFVMLHQFQVLISGVSNAYRILTFSLTFVTQNMNPNVNIWDCNNPWNTDKCCIHLRKINASDQDKATCSTPLEEFYKHYGRILHSGFYVPVSGNYDEGYASTAIWILLVCFVFYFAQLSLRDGIRCATYLLAVPGLLVFLVQCLHFYREPMTKERISEMLAGRGSVGNEYLFKACIPTMHHSYQMVIAAGYLVVLHCCRRQHSNATHLKRIVVKNLVLLAICMILYKSAIITLRHGTIGIAKDMRHRLAGFSSQFHRDTYRDMFDDSKDWIYQLLFEFIESVYNMRDEFHYQGSLKILEGASILHPVIMSLSFVAVRIVIYRAACELLFQSLGFNELLFGPWQLLTRLLIPLNILAFNFVADSDIGRDFLFPKEPYAFAYCSYIVAIFIPSLIYASCVQNLGKLGSSLYWHMMKFALRFKRAIITLGLVIGLHMCLSLIYRNLFRKSYIGVFISSKKQKTREIRRFFEYDVGLFGAPAQKAFSFTSATADWSLADVFIGCFVTFAALFGLLQNNRLMGMVYTRRKRIQLIKWKPARCLKYCLEFYLGVIFGNR